MEHRHERYLALDGLRGIAAIAAAAYDLSAAMGLRHGARGPFLHGYLAADFFFCLSGFVMARAYAERVVSRELQLRTFLTLRAIRLLPLLAIVSVAAFVLRFVFASAGDPFADDTGGRLLVDLAFGIFTIPEYFANHQSAILFPLNAPAWFIVCELLVNAVWAALLVRARGWGAVLLLCVCVVVLVPSVLSAQALDFGAERTVGIWVPFARAVVSFLSGAALWELSKGRIDEIFYFEVLATLLAIVLWLPLERSWFFDLPCILLFFPMLILFGAEAQTLVVDKPILRFLGNISFSLFAIHWPLLLLFEKFSQEYAAPLSLKNMPIVLAVWVGCAWLTHEYIERVVRVWLTRRLLARDASVDGV